MFGISVEPAVLVAYVKEKLDEIQSSLLERAITFRNRCVFITTLTHHPFSVNEIIILEKHPCLGCFDALLFEAEICLNFTQFKWRD